MLTFSIGRNHFRGTTYIRLFCPDSPISRKNASSSSLITGTAVGNYQSAYALSLPPLKEEKKQPILKSRTYRFLSGKKQLSPFPVIVFSFMKILNLALW